MATLNIGAISADFARSYLKSNPKATEDDLRVGLNNHLQELKRSGAKVSDKQIAKANATVGALYKATSAEVRANFAPNVTPQTNSAIEGLKRQQSKVAYPAYNAHLDADHHYDEVNGMSKKARQRMHKRNMAEAKEAFAGEEFAQETEPTTSNKQNEKAAKADYQSSKKRKLQKKQKEVASHREHRYHRNTKTARNAAYCTSQGIMTKPAKKRYNDIKQRLNGSINLTVSDKPNETLQKMGEYYRKQEAATEPAPQKNEAPKPQKPEAPKPQKPAPTSRRSAQAAEDAIRETKGKGKMGALVAGLGVGALALVGILSTSKKETQKDVLNEVA